MRPEAAGARFGGDEYVAILIGCEPADALDVAEHIRVQVETHEFRVEDVVVAPTITIGVAAMEAGSETPDALLHRADDALYRAKKTGRNCVSD